MKTNSSLFVNLDFSVSNPFHLNQSPGTESRSYCPVLVVMAVSQSLRINSGKKYNTSWVLRCLKVSVNLRVFFIYIFCSFFLILDFWSPLQCGRKTDITWYILHYGYVVLGLDGYVVLGLQNKMARTPEAAQMAANSELIPSWEEEQPTALCVCRDGALWWGLDNQILVDPTNTGFGE